MPRKKKFENRHFPIGLTKVKVRGISRLRYRKPNGKDFLFPIGTIEIEAIEAAIIFNKKHRNPTINLLLADEPCSKPLKHWTNIIIERVRKEELDAKKIVERVFNTFCLDIKRLETLHGEVLTKEINLNHVNSYLETYTEGKSSNVYNAKISFLKKIFSYLLDDGAMTFNPASNKKKKPKPVKERIRLSIENYNQLLNHAPLWLNIAMRLSLQTTHAVNEISVAKYKDCKWYDKPIVENNLLVFGVLRIRRQKVLKKEASRVEIPITQQIKEIIDDSRKDNLVSPYIVHQLKARNTALAIGLTHHTQLRTATISECFSELRDKLSFYDTMDKTKRPTFHEIRSLSIHMYKKAGIDPQERAAHTDAKTTKKYDEGHVHWVKILAAELVV
ncbi:MAG: integrase [Alteromonadaceae bacterium]|nr:integrase [Alteromonadaceae bacterium]